MLYDAFRKKIIGKVLFFEINGFHFQGTFTYPEDLNTKHEMKCTVLASFIMLRSLRERNLFKLLPPDMQEGIMKNSIRFYYTRNRMVHLQPAPKDWSFEGRFKKFINDNIFQHDYYFTFYMLINRTKGPRREWNWAIADRYTS